jgi:hypothetical protein
VLGWLSIVAVFFIGNVAAEGLDARGWIVVIIEAEDAADRIGEETYSIAEHLRQAHTMTSQK